MQHIHLSTLILLFGHQHRILANYENVLRLSLSHPGTSNLGLIPRWDKRPILYVKVYLRLVGIAVELVVIMNDVCEAPIHLPLKATAKATKPYQVPVACRAIQ
ncbi:hypothetical protein F4677DRAFT_405811 [Hypoxylon crocopeplum]|nr:hypothetical protein F4677DRAFT_405811 [Hypoxylon crocopeplum]